MEHDATLESAGPLAGLRVLDLSNSLAGAQASQTLADFGAEVVHVEPPGGSSLRDLPSFPMIGRGKKSIVLDLHDDGDVALAREMALGADVLIETFRPGVMERLGLGPENCLARHPGLVYGRVTGWGQSGPLAQTAGHDINYIALTGALHAIGGAEAPLPPLNLIGDFGGGAMLLAFGVVCALLEARNSGRGQVVDAAMTDGSALLMAMIYGFKAQDRWRDGRAANLLDGGAPFYGVYRCADAKFVAVGALEPQFFDAFVAGLGLDPSAFADRWNPKGWPELRARIEAAFARRPRDEWAAAFAASDACVTPILAMDEAPAHPHNRFRATFVPGDGGPQPAPAPRFSRTPAEISPPGPGGEAILRERGISDERIEALRRVGAL
jgi:alpha-methylacyl-CoA racemase